LHYQPQLHYQQNNQLQKNNFVEQKKQVQKNNQKEPEIFNDKIHARCTNSSCSNPSLYHLKKLMFYTNSKKEVFCRDCFKIGMKGMHGTLCCEDPTNDKLCFSKAIYDYPGEKGRRCAVHKKDNMINVNSGICQFHHSCGKRCKEKAEFGIVRKLRCVKHKVSNMKKLILRNNKKSNNN
jgi:hypothetical protein